MIPTSIRGVRCHGTRIISPIVIRHSSTAPRNSYIAATTPLRHFVFNHIPVNLKYFGVLGTIAASVTQLHPNTLVTLGPPALIGTYLLNKYVKRRIHLRETSKMEGVPKEDASVQLKKYVESDIYNVLNDMNSQFDHFKRQVVDVVERRTVNYIVSQNGSNVPEFQYFSSLFMDENSQFTVNVSDDDLETFVMSSVGDEKDDFIKMSFPFYSSKDPHTRKRLGIFEVYLREVPGPEDLPYVTYKILIEISSYSVRPKRFEFSRIPGEGYTKSKILLDSEAKPTDEDEMRF